MPETTMVVLCIDLPLAAARKADAVARLQSRSVRSWASEVLLRAIAAEPEPRLRLRYADIPRRRGRPRKYQPTADEANPAPADAAS